MARKCIKCKNNMKMYKQDKFRFWFKCMNKDCTYVSTEAKPLQTEALDKSK
jgi:hypothetical protein